MSDHDAILLEDMNHKLDALLEGQQVMAHIPAAVDQLQTDMTEVKGDIKIIKLAVKDQTKDHRQLEQRVTKLEQAA